MKSAVLTKRNIAIKQNILNTKKAKKIYFKASYNERKRYCELTKRFLIKLFKS